MKWFKIVIERFGEFEGRSRRKEFWMFFLFVAIIGTTISLIEIYLLKWEIPFWDQGPLETIFGLFILLPFLAVLVRRLHDIDKNWTWLFIAFIPVAGQIMIVYLLSKKGTKGTNIYGVDPIIELKN